MAPPKTSKLRVLQIEWNSLVQVAQAKGLRLRNRMHIREVALFPQGPKESIAHRRARIEWLRRELGMTEYAAHCR